jgi:hypothetical protein
MAFGFGSKLKRVIYTAISAVLVVAFVGFMAEPVFAAETLLDDTVFATVTTGHTSGPAAVWVSDQLGFSFYLNSTGDVTMASTTDGGTTWTSNRRVDSVNTTDAVSLAVWWEGWTATSAPPRYIHIATTDTGVDDIYYTRYDVASNTLSTSVVATTQGAACARAADCYPAIIQTGAGVLYVATKEATDGWMASCSTTCTTAGNWSERATFGLGDLGDDPVLLSPIGGNDNVLGIYWDVSASTIDWQIWSATSSSWSATTTLVSSIESNAGYEAQFFGMSFSSTSGSTTLIAVDDANDYSTQDHDIRFWEYSSTSGWVARTNVATNVSGGITGVKTAIDISSTTAPVYYAIYTRRATIGVATSSRVYYATSTNFGQTWSAEQGPVGDNADDLYSLTASIISNERICVHWNYLTAPRANDRYFTTIADLVPWTPPGGGGGGGGATPQDIIWFGFMLPYLFRKRGVLK